MSLNKLIYSSRPEKSNIIDILNKMLAHRPLGFFHSTTAKPSCRSRCGARSRRLDAQYRQCSAGEKDTISVHENVICRKTRKRKRKKKRKTKKKGWFSF